MLKMKPSTRKKLEILAKDLALIPNIIDSSNFINLAYKASMKNGTELHRLTLGKYQKFLEEKIRSLIQPAKTGLPEELFTQPEPTPQPATENGIKFRIWEDVSDDKKITKVVIFYADGSRNELTMAEEPAPAPQPAPVPEPAPIPLFDFTNHSIGVVTINAGKYIGCNTLDMSSICRCFGKKQNFRKWLEWQGGNHTLSRLKQIDHPVKQRDIKFINYLLKIWF